MIYGRIRLNGEEITPLQSSMNLSSQISLEWQITNSGLSFSILDLDRTWFNAIRTAPEDEPIILDIFDEDDVLYFKGVVEHKECDRNDKTGVLKLKVRDLFSREKTIRIKGSQWERDRDTVYTVIAEDGEGEDPTDTYILDHTADLYAGDILTRTFEDEDAGQQTEEITVRTVAPEFGTITVVKPAQSRARPDDVWTRKNHELWFVPLPEAIAKINTQLEADGAIVRLASEADEVFFENDSATFPFPPPRGEAPGSVLVQCAHDADRVLCVFQSLADTNTEKGMVVVGFDAEPEFTVWQHPGSGGDSGVYPLDWVNHLAAPPAQLLPPLKQHRQLGGLQIPFRDRDVTNILPPQHTFTDVDMVRAEAWELIDDQGYYLKRYAWDGADWAFAETTANFPALRNVRGFAYDHQADHFWMVRRDGVDAFLETMDRQGAITATGVAFADIRLHSLGLIATNRILYALNVNGEQIRFWDLAGAPEPMGSIRIKGGLIHAHTLTWRGSGIWFIGTDAGGTWLYHWQRVDDGEGLVWQRRMKDFLLDYPAMYPRMTKAGDHLWIGANGQLWVHGQRYKPMLVRATVAGQTIQSLLQNLAILAHAYVLVNHTGLVTLIPIPRRFESAGDPFRYRGLEETATWDGQVQSVTIKGASKSISARAKTDEPGEGLELECRFLMSNSHALALAKLELDFRKHKRVAARVELLDFPMTLPGEFEINGARFLALSIREPLVKRTTAGTVPHENRKIEALEVF